MSIFGTRPEAIKMAPVLRELEKHSKYIKSIIVVTAQHREMLDQVLNLFKLRPSKDLNIMEAEQTLTKITKKTLKGLEQIFLKEKPQLVLVQGDTTSAFASALAAFYHRIPVGHIEAGLRTDDIYNPFPEEINRRLISALATLHFAPTKWAYNNLITPDIKKENIFLTGNTVTDALFYILKHASKSGPKLISQIQSRSHKYLLVEAHRRENLGKPLEEICLALKKIIQTFYGFELVFSVHRNPQVRRVVYKILSNQNRVHLLEPLDYPDLIKLIQGAHFVLTDSGGIQEEAPSLAKPVLVLRRTTERPEGIKAGVAKLVGTNKNKIYKEAVKLIKDQKEYRKMSKAVNPYGDGKASQRIARIILCYFNIKKRLPVEFSS